MIKPTDTEIDDVIGWTIENDGKYPGMTYEQGVQDALLWIIGDADSPIAEEDED